MGPYPTYSSSRQVPVVQAYYSSKYLGLLKVNLSKRRLVPGVLPLLLGGANSSNNVQQDPELLAVLDQYRGPVDKLQTQVVGELLGCAAVAKFAGTRCTCARSKYGCTQTRRLFATAYACLC